MNRNIGPLFIGGAPRSGTTLMARLLNRLCTDIAVLPVEGWIYLYFEDYPLMNTKIKEVFIYNFLNHGRSTNTKRTEFEAPIDSSNYSLEEYMKNIPKGNLKTLDLLDWILRKYAESKNATSWGAKDNYCEFFLKKLINYFPDAKFIIMIRDPRASICSELYFGTYPDRNNEISNLLHYRLILWCLSVYTTIQLREKWPNSIMIVKYEELVSNPSSVHGKLSSFLDENLRPFADDIFPKPFSSYEKKATGFYDTRDKWRNLLSEKEVRLIESLADSYMNRFDYKKQYNTYRVGSNKLALSKLLQLSTYLSNYSTASIYHLIDFLYMPTGLLNKIYRLGKFLAVYSGLCNPNILRIKNST